MYTINSDLFQLYPLSFHSEDAFLQSPLAIFQMSIHVLHLLQIRTFSIHVIYMYYNLVFSNDLVCMKYKWTGVYLVYSMFKDMRAPPSGGDCPCLAELAWTFSSLSPDGLLEGDIQDICWVVCRKIHSLYVFVLCVCVFYLLPALVAAWALPCCWSAPASARRSVAAETYTCAPAPPPKTHAHNRSNTIVLIMQCWPMSVCVPQTYFILELAVGFCKVLDLSKEFTFSECTVLQEGHMSYIR